MGKARAIDLPVVVVELSNLCDRKRHAQRKYKHKKCDAICLTLKCNNNHFPHVTTVLQSC